MKRILIIEDDAVIATVYQRKYAGAGFETSVATDGEMGLEQLTAFKPDLVQLDLGVPKVNGVDIIQHIRSQPELEALPIIVLTNTYQNRLVKTAIEAGATVCVSKATCTPKIMLEIVERLRAKATARLSQLSPAPARAADTRDIERGTALEAEIHRDFQRAAPRMLAAVRDRVEPLLRADSDAARVPELSEMCQAAHSLAGHAGIAGLEELAQMSSALVALLSELLERPKEFTPSCLRTIVDACDFLAVLAERTADAPPVVSATAVVLVVDDDLISRRAIRLALGRLDVATISVDEPQIALGLLAENRFSLIFLDVEMPGMNGFELCKALRELPANQATPVVFVTSLSEFDSRERALASGASDVIAKPFLPMELAVKALSLLRQRQIAQQA